MNFAFFKLLPSNIISEEEVFERLELIKVASVKFAFLKSAPFNLALVKSAPSKFTFFKIVRFRKTCIAK